MNTQVTKLQAAENDLKELMADMTRAIRLGGLVPQADISPNEADSRFDRADVGWIEILRSFTESLGG